MVSTPEPDGASPPVPIVPITSLPAAPRPSTLKRRWRYLTADFRCDPDFVILGAQRSGTTSLFRWLCTHPGFSPPSKKEIHYFDVHYDKGRRWYRSHFPLKRSGRITGEASPYMLFHPLAPARAARDLPKSTRFIVLLRNPVQRTISHYWFTRQRKRFETEPIERALALEPLRLAGQDELVIRGENSQAHSGYSYVTRSEYVDQLRAWFDAVGRERILIVESEQLFANSPATVEVLDWVGLAPFGVPFPTTHQSVRLDTESPEVIAQLTDHFEPYNQKLFDLLGYELWSDQASR